jgi:hypothetical protein
MLRLALPRRDALVDRVTDDRVDKRERRALAKQIHARERGGGRRNLSALQA